MCAADLFSQPAGVHGPAGPAARARLPVVHELQGGPALIAAGSFAGAGIVCMIDMHNDGSLFRKAAELLPYPRDVEARMIRPKCNANCNAFGGRPAGAVQGGAGGQGAVCGSEAGHDPRQLPCEFVHSLRNSTP